MTRWILSRPKIVGRQLAPTSSVLIRIPKSLDKLNLITSVKLETVTVPVKLRGSVSTPLLLWIYSLWAGVAVNTWQTPKSRRCRKLLCQGEHVIHLFRPYVFIFGILCVTCAAFVCFVPFSASAQKILLFFFFYYSNTAVWLGRTRRGILAHGIVACHNRRCWIC